MIIIFAFSKYSLINLSNNSYYINITMKEDYKIIHNLTYFSVIKVKIDNELINIHSISEMVNNS
jgi:hypothetical protein